MRYSRLCRRREAREVLIDGLKRLEYRGYDSAGLALGSGEDLPSLRKSARWKTWKGCCRRSPRVHTRNRPSRWATHGGVSRQRPPHKDGSGRFAVVHNGVIENYSELKDELEREGVIFLSETDTEAIVHLVATFFSRTGDILETLVYLQKRLRGTFALALMWQGRPNSIYAIRRGSPLVLGSCEGEAFCASDIPAFLPYTRRVQYLEDGDIAEASPGGIKIWDEKAVPWRPVVTVDWGDHDREVWFPITCSRRFTNRGCAAPFPEGKGRRKTTVSRELGGTSRWYPNGRRPYRRLRPPITAPRKAFEKWTDLEIKVDIASEYRYCHIPCDTSTLAVSSPVRRDGGYSGRTAQGEGRGRIACHNQRE